MTEELRILAAVTLAWERENPAFARTPIGRSIAVQDSARLICLLDDDALDPKRDAFVASLTDSPAWGAYFAAVGATFDHGAARARRHPVRVQ